MRVALAIGEAELERRLGRALEAAGITVATRCLDAASLLEAELGGVDVALVSRRLHGVSPRVLDVVRAEECVPVVLLVDEAADAERFGRVAHLVPMGAPTELVVAAVREARERGLLYDALDEMDDADGERAGTDDGNASARGTVIAVTSGKGAPGKTTLAIALASLLARYGGEVALVDADLRGGNVAPSLDLDPGQGLVALRRGELTPDAVEAALQAGPGFRVLAGIERPALAMGLGPEVVAGAVSALRQRYGHVVVDTAGEGASAGAAEARLEVLRTAQRVLVVSGADLVSLWNTQAAVLAIARRLRDGTARLAALLNRRDGREHFNAAEVERALGIPVVGAVREDGLAARRAVAAQQPLSTASGRVAHDLEPLVSQLRSDAGEAAGRRPRRRLPGVEWIRTRGARR